MGHRQEGVVSVRNGHLYDIMRNVGSVLVRFSRIKTLVLHVTAQWPVVRTAGRFLVQ